MTTKKFFGTFTFWEVSNIINFIISSTLIKCYEIFSTFSNTGCYERGAKKAFPFNVAIF